MSADEPPQISILDARLAEIDRRLRTIQTSLVDGEGGLALGIAEPAVAEPPPPAGPPPVDLPPRVDLPSRVDLPPRVEVPPPVEVPQPVTAAGARAGSDDVLDELRELVIAHGRLLASLQRLVGSCERTLSHSGQPPPAPASPTQFSVSAGPFASTEALHGFERTLAQIPEVRDVQVRGYEGDDRAIVDVHLHDSTS